MASLEEMLRDPDTNVERKEMRLDIPFTQAPVEAGQPATPRENIRAAHKNTYKNIEMERMLKALEKHLQRTDLIGYAAARNTRILRNETVEYFKRRDELVKKYGKPATDGDGNPNGLFELKINGKGWADYSKEIEQWALVEHEPRLFLIPASEVIGKLSGAEILEIDWMIEGGQDGDNA